MRYKIEKNIPLKSKKGGGRTAKDSYPLKDMEVVDSFLVPMKEYTNKKRGVIASRISMFEKRSSSKVKFTTRRVEDGVRVWRVK